MVCLPSSVATVLAGKVVQTCSELRGGAVLVAAAPANEAGTPTNNATASAEASSFSRVRIILASVSDLGPNDTTAASPPSPGFEAILSAWWRSRSTGTQANLV